MAQLAGDDGLGLKALEKILVIYELVADYLDGADLSEGQMAGLVHRGHAADADPFQDLVLIADDHARGQLMERAQSGLVLGTGGELGGISAVTNVAVLQIGRASR